MSVVLNLDAATQRLDQKLKATKDNLTGIAEGYEDINEVSREAMTGATSDQAKLGKAIKSTDLEFDKQGKTVRQLSAHLDRLAKGQKKATDPVLIKKYNTEIAKTRAALNQVKTAGPVAFSSVNAAAKASNVVFKSLRNTLVSTFAPLVAVSAITAGIQSLISSVNDFEQEAAELSSITGATGETLEFLKQSAVEVGTETTISAQATVEAYKLIASNKPELLSNAAALAEITREAVTLTEAIGSKGDLPTAAQNLTDIMNKFQLPADQARRVVNALAAGSKEGSANIDALAASFLASGGVLRAANIPLEEGVGVLEAWAERGLKGAEAGTAFRNIVAKLSATDVLPKDAVTRLNDAGVNMEALSDQSLSFSDRLRALAPIQNDANALVSLFGLENLEAAQNILQSTDRIDELTAAVTDTNVAYEQAAINTGTASAEITKFKNTVTALIQGSSGGLSRLVGLIVSFARQGVLFLGEVFDTIGPTFSAFVDSVNTLFTAISSLLPASRTAAGEVSNFGRVAQIVTVPLRLLFGLLTTGINVISGVVNRFKALSQNSTVLSKVVGLLSKGVGILSQAFIDLPAVVVGALFSVRSFVSDVASGIFNLGSNIGKTLKEAFSIRKLITQGTGDLNNALNDLLVNPFEGIGDNARNAFSKGFNQTKELLKVPVKTELDASSEIAIPTPDASSPVATPSTIKADKLAADAAKEAAKKAKELAKLRVDALKDGAEKELALEDLRFNDLKAKLEKFNLDTSQAEIQHEQNKLAIKTKFLKEAADLEGLAGEERAKFIFDQTVAEIDALESALSTVNGGTLGQEQSKQLSLLRKTATDQYLNDINALQSAERQKAVEHEINLLELKRDGFDSQKEFEEFKSEEILNIRLKAAEEQLKIIEALEGVESDAALGIRKTINEIKGSLEELNGIEGGTEFNLYSLFGLDPNDPEGAKIIEGIEAAAGTLVGVLSDINSRRLESAEAAIKDADAQIEASDKLIADAESRLSDQEALEKKGLANNKNAVLQEIQLLKQQQAAEKVEREKALQDKKRIQKEQALLDTLTQGSSLLSASAQIFNSVAAIPFVGPIIGAGLVALMLGSFAAAKVKVFKSINNQKAEKGYFGKVTGKRHSQGGERATDHLEVEQGEAFNILNRKATRNHQDSFEAFTTAANNNDRKALQDVGLQLLGGPRTDKNVPDKIKVNVDKVKALDAKIAITTLAGGDKESQNLLKQLIGLVKNQGNGTFYDNGTKVVKRNNFIRRSK